MRSYGKRTIRKNIGLSVRLTLSHASLTYNSMNIETQNNLSANIFTDSTFIIHLCCPKSMIHFSRNLFFLIHKLSSDMPGNMQNDEYC